MNKNAYITQSISTNDIILSDEVLRLSGPMTENIHGIWTTPGTSEEGTWDEKHVEIVKRYSYPISYEELLGGKRKYNRQPDMQTLMLMWNSYFTIQKTGK